MNLSACAIFSCAQQAAAMAVFDVNDARPAGAGAAAGLAVHWMAGKGCLPPSIGAVWQDGAAWAATICFMLQPAVHLVPSRSLPSA